MPDLDRCPTCGKRITDYDEGGCESAYGQRFCLIHFPLGGLGPEDAELSEAALLHQTQVIALSDASGAILRRMEEDGDSGWVELVPEYVDSLLASAQRRYSFMDDEEKFQRMRAELIEITTTVILERQGRLN